MTHVVTENCIKCKFTDCVEVCPVDCFHEGPNFLVIDPESCIDCTLCVAECPVNAIFPDQHALAGKVEVGHAEDGHEAPVRVVLRRHIVPASPMPAQIGDLSRAVAEAHVRCRDQLERATGKPRGCRFPSIPRP